MFRTNDTEIRVRTVFKTCRLLKFYSYFRILQRVINPVVLLIYENILAVWQTLKRDMKRTRLDMEVRGNLPTYIQTLPRLPLLCEDPTIIDIELRIF